MKIGIRVDANEVVASGHIMRCRTIAESLRELGAEVIFFSADTGISSYIEGEGYKHLVLGTNWQELDSESDKLIEALLLEKIDVLLLDTYYVTRDYMARIKEAGIKLFYIDDMDKFAYPADAVLNYSPSYVECRYDEEYKDTKTSIYTGIQYVPLRSQFRDVQASESADITDIFMTSGGSDPLGISEAVITAVLAKKEFENVSVHLLAGRYFQMTGKLTTLSQELNTLGKPKLLLHQNVSDVAGIMRECQAAVTPAGTTLYELSACGVPSVSYIFAENQLADALFFDKEKLIPYAGDYREGAEKCVEAIIGELLKYKAAGKEGRKSISDKLKKQVDGKGAERIAKAITGHIMKKIFILGASMLQVPAIRKAKEKGLYVYALDYDPEAIGIKDADEFLCISTIDKEAVLKAAKEYKPDYIITSTSDMPVRTVAWVNEQLGKKNDISFEDAFCATDKAAMRRRMKEQGVPIPAFHVISTLEEFKEVAASMGEKFVIKPADNAASRGVFLIDKTASPDYDKVFAHTKEYSRSGEVLVEEFMTGPEVSVESFTVNGETRIITITDKKVTEVPYFVETGHTEPSRLSADCQEDIRRVALAAIKAVGIVNGPSHTEIKVTPDGAKLVEIAARLGGDFITSRLVPLSSGVDMIDCCVSSTIGDEVKWDRTLERGSAIRFIGAREGVITDIQGVEEALAMPGVQEVVLYKQVGDTVPKLESSGDRLGHVIAIGKDADEAEKNCEAALEKIKVVIAD